MGVKTSNSAPCLKDGLTFKGGSVVSVRHGKIKYDKGSEGRTGLESIGMDRV